MKVRKERTNDRREVRKAGSKDEETRKEKEKDKERKKWMKGRRKEGQR